MKCTLPYAAILYAAILLALAASAQAQLLDSVKGQLGASTPNNPGGLAKPEADPDYASGIQGILKGKDGKSLL